MAEVFKVEGKVTLDTSEFHAAVDDVTKEGKELAEELGESADKAGQSWENVFAHTLGDVIADFVQQASQALVDFAKESVSLASSLQEVQNVVDVTFGDSASQIEQWAKNARTQFGLTELQAKKYASTMGAMLKSMDVPTEQIYDMSTALAELAADLASFHDLSFDDAFAKIRAGISGETEPLKQLGINLNVANLEAYALKNGIKGAWQEMSLAEQAMLRYNYILDAASDAQGDFARTSDSYANSMRILETNINSTKATLGEAFIPVLTSAANWLNSLYEKDSATILSEMEAGFYATSAAIELNSTKAKGLIDVIEQLQGKQSLTADETLRYKGAVEVLCGIYPELSKYVDKTNGFFTESAETLREETNAISENLLEKARLAYQEERLALLAADVAKNEYDYSVTTAQLVATTTALEAYGDQIVNVDDAIVQLCKNASEYTGELFDERAIGRIKGRMVNEGKTLREAFEAEFYHAFTPLDDAFFTNNQALFDTANGIGSVNEEYARLVSEKERLTAAEKEQAEAVKTSTEAFEAEFEALGETTEQVNEALEEIGETEDPFAGMTESTADFKKSLEEVKTQAEDLQKMLAELESYRLDKIAGIQKQIEGAYGAFDNAGKVKGTTASKMFSGMDSQVEQLERFQEAYTQLQEMGAGEDLLSQFEFSPESIGQMEALIKSGAEGVATANEKMAALETKQAEVATMLAETALKVDSEYQTMLTAAETANQELTSKMTSITEGATAMSSGVTQSSTTATTALDTVQTAGDKLGLSEWEPKINPEDNATGVIASVSSALEALDGKHVYTYIHTIYVVGAGGVSKPGIDGLPNAGTGADVKINQKKATGLDYVPYDEYAAYLHKGEAVLTKAEADNWRKGTKLNSGLQPINVTLNLNGVAQNPYEVADEVRNALELMRWRA